MGATCAAHLLLHAPDGSSGWAWGAFCVKIHKHVTTLSWFFIHKLPACTIMLPSSSCAWPANKAQPMHMHSLLALQIIEHHTHPAQATAQPVSDPASPLLIVTGPFPRNIEDIPGDTQHLQAEKSAINTHEESSSKIMGINRVTPVGSSLEQLTATAAPSGSASSQDVAERSN